LRKSQISIDRLIPVSERAFREVAIQSLDHGRARQRGTDMRGRDQTWTEIGRVRSNRHVCFIGGFNYVPHDRNSSDLGNARLDVVHRPAFDQPRKIGRRQDIFTDGDWHAAGADLPRGVKIIERPDRLLNPFETEFAQRRDRRQCLLQRPRRIDVHYQRAAVMPPQQLRGGGNFFAAGFVHFEVAISTAKRFLAVPHDDRRLGVFKKTGIGRKLLALGAAQQHVDRLVCRFSENVPKRNINSGKRVHDRTCASDAVDAVDQHFHQSGNVGRLRADACRRDQGLQQQFDGRPNPMRKCFTPADDAAIGFDLDQQRLERIAALAGEFRLGAAKFEFLAVNNARYARDFHCSSEPGPERINCWRARLSLSWTEVAP